MARIVLLDDEARLLQLLTLVLEPSGHQLFQGQRFSDVEAHLWPGRFELLITDIVMPETNGMEVLRTVVTERGCQEPVMLLTGDPNVGTASEAVRGSAFDYIVKPFTRTDLLEAVARGLRHVTLLRERDLARATEMELLANLARLGESAAVLSHEIRTPITSLRQALRAVGEKLGLDDRVLIEEHIANLDRIETLLGRTLSFARPLRLERRTIEIASVLAEAAAQARALPVMQAMTVELRCAAGLAVDADPKLLGEVFVNLFRNAAEACDGKGIIEVTCKETESRVALQFADTGPGVPPELVASLFQPFRTTKANGTGIGLALSRKVIESHGGTISLAGGAGPGTCFVIELPRKDSRSPRIP